METKRVTLKYKPYKHQQTFHAGSFGKRNALFICARQHGKSEAAIAEVVDRALQDTTQSMYAVVMPFIAQGRKNLWPRMKKFLAPIEKHCKFKETDLIVELPNGTSIIFLGADNEGARGYALKGILVDEFDNISTETWNSVFLPTQASFGDDAWCIFIGTLGSGYSKLWELHERHKDDPDWFVQVTKASEAKLLTQSNLEKFRRAMGNSHFLREFECDPSAPPEHSVLGEAIERALLDRRIDNFPLNHAAELWCSFDLGIRDQTAIWVFYIQDNFFYFIGYHEFGGLGLPEIIGRLKQQYIRNSWRACLLPHDINVRDLSTGAARYECFADYQLGEPEVVRKVLQADSIYAARMTFDRCYFHKTLCEKGLQRLTSCEYAVDQHSGTVLNKVRHNDHSHCFDSFKYAATYLEDRWPTGSGTLRDQMNRNAIKPRVIRSGDAANQRVMTGGNRSNFYVNVTEYTGAKLMDFLEKGKQ